MAVLQVFSAYNLCKFFVSLWAYQLARADYPDKIPNGAIAPVFGPKTGKHLLSLFSNRTWRFNTTSTNSKSWASWTQVHSLFIISVFTTAIFQEVSLPTFCANFLFSYQQIITA